MIQQLVLDNPSLTLLPSSSMLLTVRETIQHAGSIPAVSTKALVEGTPVDYTLPDTADCYQSLGGDDLVSIGLDRRIRDIRQATTVIAQTTKAKNNVLAMRGNFRPTVNVGEMAYAALISGKAGRVPAFRQQNGNEEGPTKTPVPFSIWVNGEW